MPETTVPGSVTWGLLAAFAVHDLEELLTMPAHNEQWLRGLRARYPAVPERMWTALRTDGVHTATAIGLMGLLVAAAAAQGARTGGRSEYYQTVLAGFGLHGIVHIGQSLVERRYTPGVVTAPGVIAFSWWAWRRLRKAGLVAGSGAAYWFAAFPVVLAGVHGGAHGLRALARRLTRGSACPATTPGGPRR
ncbi:HXXEE domain-containing protein [Crossiella sp. NPDC003009]